MISRDQGYNRRLIFYLVYTPWWNHDSHPIYIPIRMGVCLLGVWVRPKAICRYLQTVTVNEHTSVWLISRGFPKTKTTRVSPLLKISPDWWVLETRTPSWPVSVMAPTSGHVTTALAPFKAVTCMLLGQLMMVGGTILVPDDKEVSYDLGFTI